jgi:hypothetical protein
MMAVFANMIFGKNERSYQSMISKNEILPFLGI